MIYTSYFARLKDLPEDCVPISISLYSPKWYHGLKYITLAPSPKILNKWKEKHDERLYTVCFRFNILRLLNPKKVEKDLYKLSGGRDVVLVCYEKFGDFCHRHLVTEWFIRHGIKCKELKFDGRKKKNETANTSNSRRARYNVWK